MKHIVSGLTAAIGLAVLASSASAQSVSPSFNCNQDLNRTERAICNNDDLAFADLEMVRVYNEARRFASGADRNLIRNEQRNWLRTRNACRADVGCLRIAINNRITALNRYIPGDLPDEQQFNPPAPPPPPPPPPPGNTTAGQGGIGGVFGDQGQPQTFPDVTTNYACDSGAQVQVTFVNSANPPTATLLAGGQLYVLQSAVSGSGFRYTNGAIELTGKARNITLEFGGQFVNCVER